MANYFLYYKKANLIKNITSLCEVKISMGRQPIFNHLWLPSLRARSSHPACPIQSLSKSAAFHVIALLIFLRNFSHKISTSSAKFQSSLLHGHFSFDDSLST